MNWKFFLVFPLAALITAKPLQAPLLKPAIPIKTDPGCDYHLALRYYLQAYAYSHELPSAARKFLGAAERERAPCRESTTELAERIRALRRLLTL